MALLNKSIGARRDWPQLESINVSAVSAGSGNDYEHQFMILTNLATGAPAGSAGDLPVNNLTIRNCYLSTEAAITGASAHFMSYCFRQYRAGAVVAQVNTTSATSITSGSTVVTPASMSNIQLNQLLYFSGGTGSAETVVVTAVTATTFTATFANNHSGAYTIVCNNFASITFNANTITTVAYTPVQLLPGTSSNGMTFLPGVLVLPGDMLTAQRLSSDSTGLASPATFFQIEWLPARING